MNLEDKKRIVEDLHKKFSNAAIAIVTDYKGLNVAAITELRKRLREASIDYQVVKNTLLTRASEDTDSALIKDRFKGPCAVALGYDDPAAPAKILTKFAEENNNLEIRAGVMDNKVFEYNDIKALSLLPSRDILLGQMLSALNGVSTGLVRTLSAVPAGFVNVLQAIKEQKETE
ncbi:Large ribosomal subunit protein uL10 [Candidatus Magnetomoraceae bacterium gMMP-15]